MTTMNKSTSAKANSSAGVASGADINREVNVVGVGTGRLRYVGGVQGKDGLFCGIELDLPIGKHDGTFQGVSYFTCPAGHGIFAPIYKVELLTSLSPSRTFVKSQNSKLSRSAIPALPLRNVFSPASHPPSRETASTSLNSSSSSGSSASRKSTMSMDPLSSSQMSTGSELLNNSFILDGSWTIEDAMCTSNDTFIVPGNPLAHEFSLMDVEKPTSILQAYQQHLDSLNNLGTSQVLEESRIGVEYLPVVEDEEPSPDEPEEDLETPCIPVQRSIAVAINGNLPPATALAVSSTRPVSQTSIDTGYHDESDSHQSPAHKDHTRTTPDVVTTKEIPVTEVVTRKMASKTNRTSVKGVAPSPPPVAPKEPKVKKVSQEALPPQPPKFPVKPKPPSKHQLMMQKIQESIAAEKAKPRKDPKPRVSLLPPVSPEKKEENSKSPDENERMRAVAPANESADSPKRRRADAAPLKTLNSGPVSKASSSASKESVNATPREPREVRKPRVSLLPPPKDANATPKAPTKPKDDKTASATLTTNGTAPAKKPATPASAAAKLKQSNFPTSSFAPKVGQPRASTKAAAAVPAVKTIDEAQKLARLQRASKAFEIMTLVCELNQKKCDHLSQQLGHAADEIGEKFAYIEDLKRQLDEVHRESLRTARDARAQAEEVQRRHEERIADLKAEFEKKLLAAEEEAKRNLEETESRHEQQIDDLTRRHQNACAALDEKIAEAERNAEQLSRDKAKLQQALANDKDSKVQTLTAEINSLNTAMSLKSVEMKELRLQLAKLQIQVDEIPAKDIEITKLRHKLKEFKAVVDQKRDTEKALVSENEDLRRHLRSFSQMNESMKKEVDVLRYHMEEMSDGDTSLPGRVESSSSRESGGGLFHTPSATLPVRGRHGITEVARPFSAVVPKTTQSTHGDPMVRSLELDTSGGDALTRSSFATFRESGRKHQNGSEDVIYAPEETIVTHNNVAQKLSYSDEDEEDPPNKEEPDLPPEARISL